MTSRITAFMPHNYSQHWKFMTHWETALESGAVICMQRGNYTVQPLLCLLRSVHPAQDGHRFQWLLGMSWTTQHHLPCAETGWRCCLQSIVSANRLSCYSFCICPLHSKCGSLRHLMPKNTTLIEPLPPPPPLIIEDLLKCFCLPFFIPYGPLGNMTQCGH